MNKAERTKTQFDWRRGAFIACAVTLFIIVFQPFGFQISTVQEFVLALGFAPVNFSVMMLSHRLSFSGAARFAPPFVVVLANLLYVFLLRGGPSLAAATAVILVSALVIGIVSFWNRERALHREVIELRQHAAAAQAFPITLRDDSERDILKLTSCDLLMAAAKGNYVEITYLKDDAPATALLRKSLKTLAGEVPEDTMIRAHRSFLINPSAAQRIVTSFARMTIEFAHGLSAPVSRQYRDAIRAAVTT